MNAFIAASPSLAPISWRMGAILELRGERGSVRAFHDGEAGDQLHRGHDADGCTVYFYGHEVRRVEAA